MNAEISTLMHPSKMSHALGFQPSDQFLMVRDSLFPADRGPFGIAMDVIIIVPLWNFA